ncbi:MAG TPA: bifunctional precorrin-2 dehydrogenase/sirohydrochlorin ferrochelatase [Bacillota bacterium]|jgi:precorrin-2 dehydrogenase/sirohydrochlorin ferrochelatase
MPAYYPISLNLTGRPCLVVGGGSVAARKTASLLEAGAKVTVVAPDIGPPLDEMAAAGLVVLRRRPFDRSDLEGCDLVVAATDDPAVNQTVSTEARGRRVLVNVVDDPERSDYIVPAVVRRGALCLAVTTDGYSPALAKRIRDRLASEFGPEYGQFLDWLGETREKIKREEPDETRRKALFEALVDSNVLAKLRDGRAKAARDEFDRLLRERPRSDQ